MKIRGYFWRIVTLKGLAQNVELKISMGMPEKCYATYSATDLIDPVSVLSGQPPVLKDSTHYFLIWSIIAVPLLIGCPLILSLNP